MTPGDYTRERRTHGPWRVHTDGVFSAHTGTRTTCGGRRPTNSTSSSCLSAFPWDHSNERLPVEKTNLYGGREIFIFREINGLRPSSTLVNNYRHFFASGCDVLRLVVAKEVPLVWRGPTLPGPS